MSAFMEEVENTTQSPTYKWFLGEMDLLRWTLSILSLLCEVFLSYPNSLNYRFVLEY